MTGARAALAAVVLGFAAGPAAADAEREVIALVAGLDGAPDEERAQTLRALAPHGDLAVDVVLEFMQEGLLARSDALAAVAALQSGAYSAGADEDAASAAPDSMPQAEARSVDLSIATPPSAPDDTLYHRVTGVAPDDVLNIRDRAGVPGSTIIGSFAPNAEGIELVHGPDAHEIVNGSSWQKVRRDDLTGGTGWVNTRYLDPMFDAADAVFEEMDRAAIAAEYVSGDGYEPRDIEIGIELTHELGAEDQTAFSAAGRLAPPIQAVLLLEAQDGVLPHARYRLRYGAESMPNPPGAAPVMVNFMQIDRFNLGPAHHAELVRSAGADVTVPPVTEFGEGPHVSWRIVSSPIQGHVSNLNAVSRAEFGDPDADGARCLDIDCLSLAPAAEAVPEPWSEMTAMSGPSTRVYETIRDDAHSPAALMEVLLGQSFLTDPDSTRWRGPEAREGVDFAQPFMEIVIETGLGQDAGAEAVMREANLMDDDLAMLWWRAASVASGDPAAPLLYGAEARKRHEWRE